MLAGRVPDKKPTRSPGSKPLHEKIELARREEEQAVQPGQKWRGHIKQGAFGCTQIMAVYSYLCYVVLREMFMARQNASDMRLMVASAF